MDMTELERQYREVRDYEKRLRFIPAFRFPEDIIVENSETNIVTSNGRMD